MLTNNAFTYDQVGNRLSKQQNSSQSNALVAGSFNNLNQLTALSGGNGKLQVSGTVSKISKVTVLSGTNSYPATALWGTNFSASIAASLGTNTFTVVAQDANTNLVTNTYQIAVTALEGSRSFIYDANGNCLSDGQRSYQWDAENRLASVTVGTNVYSFGYDFAGRRVSEKLNGTLIKQTLWDTAGNAPTPLEERNSANAVAKRFFAQGEQQNGTNYYYLRDHLGSVRELVTGSGQIVSEATYDPYGVATVSGTVTPTFQYAGYYAHQGSGLNLTWYRSYDPVIGRWQARDPLPNAERLQGLNLYGYCINTPTLGIDVYGLDVFIIQNNGVGGHAFIGIGGIAPPGNNTYGAWPSTPNILGTPMIIQHPDPAAGGYTPSGCSVQRIKTTTSQEKALENWIKNNFDINGENSNLGNPYYMFPFRTCRNFPDWAVKQLNNIK